MDRTKPYIQMERGASGNEAAIHLIIPGKSHAGVIIRRDKEGAAAFDYFLEKLKDGVNL